MTPDNRKSDNRKSDNLPPDNFPPPDRSRYARSQPQKNPVPVVLVLVVVSVLLFLARNWSALNANYQAGSQDASPPAIAELHAGVTTEPQGDDRVITVINNDSFPWNHVIIDVDAMASSGEHRVNCDRIAPGDQVRFTASQVNIRNGMVSDVEVYTIQSDGTKTGEWEGMLRPR